MIGTEAVRIPRQQKLRDTVFPSLKTMSSALFFLLSYLSLWGYIPRLLTKLLGRFQGILIAAWNYFKGPFFRLVLLARMRKLVWISYLHLLPKSLHISKPHLNANLLLLRAPTPCRHSHPSLSTSPQIYSPAFQLAARGTRNNHKKGCHETSSQVLKIQALDTSLYA